MVGCMACGFECQEGSSVSAWFIHPHWMVDRLVNCEGYWVDVIFVLSTWQVGCCPLSHRVGELKFLSFLSGYVIVVEIAAG